MDEEEDEELSESGINPPAYTPPEAPGDGLLPPEKVIVTQPTPEVEQVVVSIPPDKKAGETQKPTATSSTSPTIISHPHVNCHSIPNPILLLASFSQKRIMTSPNLKWS